MAVAVDDRSWRDAHDAARVPAWELAAVAALVGCYLLADALAGTSIHESVNAAGPLCLTLILGFSAARLSLADASAIWTGLFWFRVSTAVYFGAGSLIPEYVNETTRAYIEGFFRFHAEHVFKVNLVTAAGVATVLGTAACLERLWPGVREPRAPAVEARHAFSAGLLFGAVGIAAKYLVVLPYLLGLTADVLPGAVVTLALLSPVSIYLLTLGALSARPAWLPPIIGFAVFETLVGLLSFNKTEALLAPLMVLLAILSVRATATRLLASAAVMALAYLAFVPIIEHGRRDMGMRYGSLQGAAIAERLEILTSFFSAPTAEEHGGLQTGLARLSYVNAAAFAVQLHDSGLPGHSLENMATVVVPRFLWPDKPVITDVGIDFNVLATANPRSSSAPGLFAEAYWNFGWLGIPLLMAPFGAILYCSSQYASRVLSGGRWLYFPVVLLGMKMGWRIDGHYVSDVAGTLVIMIVLHVMIYAVERGWRTLETH